MQASSDLDRKRLWREFVETGEAPAEAADDPHEAVFDSWVVLAPQHSGHALARQDASNQARCVVKKRRHQEIRRPVADPSDLGADPLQSTTHSLESCEPPPPVRSSLAIGRCRRLEAPRHEFAHGRSALHDGGDRRFGRRIEVDRRAGEVREVGWRAGHPMIGPENRITFEPVRQQIGRTIRMGRQHGMKSCSLGGLGQGNGRLEVMASIVA
ncbi:MAG TPA: hypothetical protein VMV10_30885 [Pirellulales bacterium]|nr:hypothetical protein [Pirellulales bacterium]